MAGPIFHRAAPYEEFFSWGGCHHCPMEVGAYACTGHITMLQSTDLEFTGLPAAAARYRDDALSFALYTSNLPF